MEEFTGLTGPMKASLGIGHTSQEWKRVHSFPFLVSLVSLTCPGENSLGGGGTVSLAWLSRNSPALFFVSWGRGDCRFSSLSPQDLFSPAKASCGRGTCNIPTLVPHSLSWPEEAIHEREESSIPGLAPQGLSNPVSPSQQ